jgi:hypothetical protein
MYCCHVDSIVLGHCCIVPLQVILIVFLVLNVKFFFFFFFFFFCTEFILRHVHKRREGRIRTSDLILIKRGLQPIKLHLTVYIKSILSY